MHFYLAPYRGAGTWHDPYCPVGSEQPGWTAIDLRPDATQRDGYALLAAPDPVRKAIRIGEHKLETMAESTRRLFARALRTSLDAGWLLSEAIGQLLLRPPRHGWKPLRQSRGLYVAWLGAEAFFLQPAIAGGAIHRDDFNRANGGLGANWTTMTSFLAPLIVSNQVNPTSVDTSWSAARYSAGGIFQDAQYASIEAIALTNADVVAPAVRMHASLATFYLSPSKNSLGAGTTVQIEKIVAGSFTTLVSQTVNTPANTIARLEVLGSTLIRKNTGVQVLTPLSDMSIESGQPGMMIGVDGGGATTDAALDNWEGGDLNESINTLWPILVAS